MLQLPKYHYFMLHERKIQAKLFAYFAVVVVPKQIA